MSIAVCLAVALLTVTTTGADAGEMPRVALVDQGRPAVARVTTAAVAPNGAPLEPGGRDQGEMLQAEQRQRLAQLEGRWSLAFWAIVVLSLALSVVGAVAAVARRRERGATRFARSMAQELEEKRRTGLAERQQHTRRIGELEERIRQLEGGRVSRAQ